MLFNIIRVGGFKKMIGVQLIRLHTYHLGASLAGPDDLRLDQVGDMKKLIIDLSIRFKLLHQGVSTVNILETAR